MEIVKCVDLITLHGDDVGGPDVFSYVYKRDKNVQMVDRNWKKKLIISAGLLVPECRTFSAGVPDF